MVWLQRPQHVWAGPLVTDVQKHKLGSGLHLRVWQTRSTTLRGVPRGMKGDGVGGGHSGFCLWMLCPGWPFNVAVASWAVDVSPTRVT